MARLGSDAAMLSLMVSAGIAGAAYVLLPGPAFLAMLDIGAARGRRAAAAFLIGALAGDTLWAVLALIGIIGAHVIGHRVFDALSVVCGLYLGWLGLRAVLARRDATGAVSSVPRHPLRRGMAIGLTNPKGYPVATAMFSALLAGHGAALGWSSLPWLLLGAGIGVVAADAVLVALVGIGAIRRFHGRHALALTRASGVIFIGFDLHTLSDAAPGLLASRS